MTGLLVVNKALSILKASMWQDEMVHKLLTIIDSMQYFVVSFAMSLKLNGCSSLQNHLEIRFLMFTQDW